MALSDEVALILRGQNLSKAAFDEAIASLKTFRTSIQSATKSVGLFNDAVASMPDSIRKSIVSLGDGRIAVDAYTRSLGAAVDAQRAFALSSPKGVTGGGGGIIGGGGAAVARDSSFLRAGSTSIGPASFGGSALGIPVPAIAAAVAAYLGFKTVQQSNAYFQSVADVVASSSQNAGSIGPIAQGILNLTGGQNRFTPQQLQSAQYAIASTPAFSSTAATLAALKVVSAQGQATGASSLPALAKADTAAANAFGLISPRGFAAVADIIAKGVNIGAAEPVNFATGVGTFAASARAAGLSGTQGLAGAAGLFAASSVLNPRYRFDAQGENSLFQQITGIQSKGAQGVEQGLNIQNLFGVGAVGKAGGVAQWAQQLQRATAALGPEQQQRYLQALFPRQNALAFVRGVTGANFASGQQAIAANLNYGGTVAAGQSIADKGPQAQWDQIQGQFNKDVIEVGKTINDSLKPALTTLAANTMQVAGVMGNALGILGTSIDKYVKFIDGIKLPGGASLIPGGFGTDLLATALGLPGAVLAGTWGAVSHAGQIGNAAGSLLNFLNPTNSSSGPPTTAGVPAGGRFNWNPLSPIEQGAVNALHGPAGSIRAVGQGSAQQGLSNILSGARGAGSSALSALESAGSYITAYSTAVSYQQSLAHPAAKPLSEAAIRHGARDALTLALGENTSASAIQQALNSYITAVRNSSLDPNTKAYNIYQAQQAVQSYLQQQATTAANTAATQTQVGYSHVQAVLSNAQYSGTGVEAATSGEISFLKAHPTLWGGDPAILQGMINSIHGAAGGTGAIPKAVTQNLIRPNLPYDQLTAGFGASVARLTGGAGQGNDLVRSLEKQLAAANEEIAILKGTKKDTEKIAAAGVSSAKNLERIAAAATAPAARTGIPGNIPGRRR